MTREEILSIINRIIEEEHGKEVTEGSLLVDCNIDSFGYAIFWTTLEAELDIKVAKTVMDIDYGTFTVKDVIDMLQGLRDVSPKL